MDNNMKKIKNIIEALCWNKDIDSIRVLEELGTNCANDEVRELTARALVRKNITESLSVAISNKGKGINDLSPSVAMSTINELISLENKDIAMDVLSDTVKHSQDKEVKENARSVRALLTLS